ncbi:MAG: ThiF family adenylyltransferase [Deltaproteobacteria bacterium]|nr:ThiF family adenylyltransferase [Deltaproteobacteria bacterium]
MSHGEMSHGEPIHGERAQGEVPLMDFTGFYARTTPLLGVLGMERLHQAKIAVAGCGGVGGAHAITMARLGVGRFHLADPGVFDPPDMNRQWAATGETMDRNKAKVYKETLRSINPAAEIEVFAEGVQPDNHGRFLEGANILLDCLDVSVPLEQRAALYAQAHEQGIFVITSPIIGFGCLVAASRPGDVGMEDFVSIFSYLLDHGTFPPGFHQIFVPHHLGLVEEGMASGKIPSLALAPLIATSLVATECLAFLLEGLEVASREPVTLPRMIAFDLMRLSYTVVHAGELLNTGGIKEGAELR